MKRFLFLLLSIVLVAIEVSLVADLLPHSWMPGVVHHASKGNPQDWSQSTHPAMGYELDQVIKGHPWLKLSFTFFEILLIAGNAWLIYRLYKSLRSS